MQTLYQAGREEILRLIQEYLDLLAASDGLQQVRPDHFENEDWKQFLCCGKGLLLEEVPESPTDAYAAYTARAAVPHDLESAISGPLYLAMRDYAAELAETARRLSSDFTHIGSEELRLHSELLPVFLHATGTFSKSVLAREVGTVSDTAISGPASIRLEGFFSKRLPGPQLTARIIIDRLGSTIEGQVRDLLGRYLLESLVEAALSKAEVPFQREEQYTSLAGVVYDHRADFVIPSASEPLIFVEVRKSSARHSSLYAKDKMFSAINWKGKNQGLIGVLIADGDWSRQALVAMSRVFDYVLPVNKADELARIAKAYVAGDSSVLLRVIHFSIEERIRKV